MDVEYLTSDELKGFPFSEAVRVDRMLYLSGQVGHDGRGALVSGGMEAEARQTMDNIRRVLERHGTSLDHLVKVLVMLADMTDWPAFNEIYTTYFTNHLPARSALGANALALGARVEVECIAVIPARDG